MSPIDGSDEDGALEECIEELEEAIMSLDRHPPATIAVALGTYLEGLLGALLDEGRCTAGEVREFLQEIASGVIDTGPQRQPPAPAAR